MISKYLYFWNNDINVGDYASNYIVNKLSTSVIAYKNPFIKIINILFNLFKYILGKESHTKKYIKDYIFPWQKIIFGVGSILDFAPKNAVVWGSGFREYNSQTNAINILAVRGYLSRNLLNNQDKIVVGDPALLLPIIYPKKQCIQKKIAIIPHYKEVNIFKEFNTNNYDIIDPRTTNVEDFINKIVQYEYILSSSLHGVIISHSYGIKALWIRHGNVGSSDFKYYDYFSSVNIINYPILNALKIIQLTENEITLIFSKNYTQSLPQCNLATLQSNLLKCAPFGLKDYIYEKNVICY